MSDESTKKKSIKKPAKHAKPKTTKKESERSASSKSRTLREDLSKKHEEEAALALEDNDEVITDAPLDGSDAFEAPGALRGTSKLILETRKAQMVYEGRKPDKTKNKQFIMGLNSYASSLRIIYDASGQGDPYADYWLIQVERALEEKMELFDEKIKEYSDILGQYENISHEVAHSVKPVSKTLRFSIAYSYQGATMLMKLDQLVRTILTANHVGLVDTRKANYDIDVMSRKARSVFKVVEGYRYCDVKRDDIAANNPKAQRAQELMGACPFAILDDELTPKFVSNKAMFLKNERSGASDHFYGE